MVFLQALLGHYICDFLLQTRWMGENKSKDMRAMLSHITIYTLGMMLFIDPLIALVNGIAHFAVDMVTSRLSGLAYRRGNMHLFWAVIGLDQLLHVAFLYYTLEML